MADPPRRVNFFPGLLLTAADLAEEQQYHRGMRYLQNRLRGYGSVWGLDVVVADGEVHVSAGVAIDLCGREIVVTQTLILSLEPLWAAGPGRADLVIAWHESPDGPVIGSDGQAEFTRWVEVPQLAIVGEGEAGAEALVLARLTWSTGTDVNVDPSVRRAFAPA